MAEERLERLVQPFHVQHVRQRLAVEVRTQIPTEQLRYPRILLETRTRRVRTHEHVGHVPERAIRRQSLPRSRPGCRILLLHKVKCPSSCLGGVR